MDAELIRKAAEAIWEGFRKKVLEMEPGDSIASTPFSKLEPAAQERCEMDARSALTVFYEHTRAQTRERKPPNCPDCNTPMTPTGASLVFMKCPNCGGSA